MAGFWASLPISFAVPGVLALLALLPALWVLLRLTPPRPRAQVFPPLRLLLDLAPTTQTPARTPWWLLMLRLLLAGALILAMAGPVWTPRGGRAASDQPVVLVLDNGWAAAPDWDQRIAAARDVLAQARGPVAVLATAQAPQAPALMDATRAQDVLRGLAPQPITPDRAALIPIVQAFLGGHPTAQVVWIADGLDATGGQAFAQSLKQAQALRVLQANTTPLALTETSNGAKSLDVRVVRADTGAPASGSLIARDAKGLALGETSFAFQETAQTTASFELPLELRNAIARVEIKGEASAGAVSLTDTRHLRQRIGLVSGASLDNAQPLLSPLYYLTKALTPFAEVREARVGEATPIANLLDQQCTMLVLADVGAMAAPERARLEAFLAAGGVVLRFAGSRLAGSSDDLVPVRLRRGGRVLGGSLSWDTPKHLAPFDTVSPLAGLTVPPDVTVSRQVLAEPEPGLTRSTWAALADGTPLITGVSRGKGLLVLVHVSADTTWSNLPLSGLFVDMLHRIVDLAARTGGPMASAADPEAPPLTTPTSLAPILAPILAPTSTLDGFGVLGAPPASAEGLAASFTGEPSLIHPPGLYGVAGAQKALNTLQPGQNLQAMNLADLGIPLESLQPTGPLDLRATLLGLALLAYLADMLASLVLSGGLAAVRAGLRRPVRLVSLAILASGLALSASLLAPSMTRAAEPEKPLSARDLEAVLHTKLAFVVSGDAAVDQVSLDGLRSLSQELARRTALKPGEPVGVDPARDQLVFYPLLYWPIVAGRPQPSPSAIANAANFMKQGGTIVFDTRDALTARPDGPPSPEALWLRTLLAGVDVPELEPVPRDHVVTKTFYLLDGFVGRTTLGQTWIEALQPPDTGDSTKRPARAGDDVSPLVITGNDLAVGWAADRLGEPLFPLIPGGARQHELAIRGGVNLVMYTLTGNYKADQVHVRELLERLAR